MVERLNEIRSRVADAYDRERAEADYAAAFRDYRIDVNALDKAEAGGWVTACPIGVELAVALDHWTLTRRRRQPPDRAGAVRLAAVANIGDRNPWRVQRRQKKASPHEYAAGTT
jgi:hypothetical protein